MIDVKKTPKANLEDKRFTYILMGLVLSLGVFYVAFEWTDKEITVYEQATDEEVFFEVEKMPEFPGGQKELMKYFSENIKYPIIAQENGIQGRVIVQFTVRKDGSIDDVQVVRSADPSLDKEAIRLIKSMPKWTPGQQRGKAVHCKFTVPVVFKLQM